MDQSSSSNDSIRQFDFVSFADVSRPRTRSVVPSEECKEGDGSMWGNFPQAYSHVGLLNAATRIAKKLDQPDFY